MLPTEQPVFLQKKKLTMSSQDLKFSYMPSNKLPSITPDEGAAMTGSKYRVYTK
jgi:hypothetical protein